MACFIENFSTIASRLLEEKAYVYAKGAAFIRRLAQSGIPQLPDGTGAGPLKTYNELADRALGQNNPQTRNNTTSL